MFSYKAQTYEGMEKQKPDKKFKQNSYEEIRKLVEQNDVERQQINSIVNNTKCREAREPLARCHVAYANKKKKNTNENTYSFKLFD